MSLQKSDAPLHPQDQDHHLYPGPSPALAHVTQPHASVSAYPDSKNHDPNRQPHPHDHDPGSHAFPEPHGKQDGPGFTARRSTGKLRAFSVIESNHRKNVEGARYAPPRRFSNDIDRHRAVEFEVYVDETYASLIQREDTDHNIQITIEDKGPKWINLGTLASEGYFKRDIRTTYHLSNLLQELYLAKEKGLKRIVLSEARINENPVSRLSRIIKDDFWPNLTRRIDGSNVAVVGRDPKDWTIHPRPRIYIPVGAPEQYEYYNRIAREHPEVDLDVQWLANDPSNEEYVRDLNQAPGLLALEMERVADTRKGEPNYQGLPFVVPGGRFNELYGWDSYMESLGLIIHKKVHLAKNMVKHFCFCIKHFGKILNANRTYYLCRTQPPFLTDMAIRVYKEIQHEPDAKEFLRTAILAAIKEYYNVWMSSPRYDTSSGLSRYRAQGIGVPPETEATHFEHILTPFAKRHNLSYKDFIHAYNYGHILEPELDTFFLHDRAVRESGHDTSYRLENVAADLATVDLNSCLYAYERDIAHIIATEFDGALTIPKEFLAYGHKEGYVERPGVWEERCRRRKELMDRHMWDEDKGMYFDYHCVHRHHTGYESATTFWALWAGVASPHQAEMLVHHALPRFEVGGGLVSGTEVSRGEVGLLRPNRQWDYPFGWAPQQILAWHGLVRYGFVKDAQRLAYRWLFMVTKAFVDFNGVVVEKYNVTDPRRPHVVAAEYGNQGSDFKGAPREGFGWVNASYVVGLEILDESMRRRLGALASWDEYREKKTPRHRASFSHVPLPAEAGHETAGVGHAVDEHHDHRETEIGQEHHGIEEVRKSRFGQIDGAVDWRDGGVF